MKRFLSLFLALIMLVMIPLEISAADSITETDASLSD